MLAIHRLAEAAFLNDSIYVNQHFPHPRGHPQQLITRRRSSWGPFYFLSGCVAVFETPSRVISFRLLPLSFQLQLLFNSAGSAGSPPGL